MRSPLRVAAAVSAAAVLTLAGAGVALAQQEPPTTGPDTVACAETQARVVARAAVAATAADALDALPDVPAEVQTLIDAQLAVIVDLRAELDAAMVALDAAPSSANAAEAIAAGEALTDAFADLVAIPGVSVLGAATQAVIDARAALAAALVAQESACEEPETTPTPEPTTVPTPTTEPTETPDPTTPASTTTPAPAGEDPLFDSCAEARAAGAAPMSEGDAGYTDELDTDDDGVACELVAAGTLPIGGAATGG